MNYIFSNIQILLSSWKQKNLSALYCQRVEVLSITKAKSKKKKGSLYPSRNRKEISLTRLSFEDSTRLLRKEYNQALACVCASAKRELPYRSSLCPRYTIERERGECYTWFRALRERERGALSLGVCVCASPAWLCARMLEFKFVGPNAARVWVYRSDRLSLYHATYTGRSLECQGEALFLARHTYTYIYTRAICEQRTHLCVVCAYYI